MTLEHQNWPNSRSRRLEDLLWISGSASLQCLLMEAQRPRRPRAEHRRSAFMKFP